MGVGVVEPRPEFGGIAARHSRPLAVPVLVLGLLLLLLLLSLLLLLLLLLV